MNFNCLSKASIYTLTCHLYLCTSPGVSQSDVFQVSNASFPMLFTSTTYGSNSPSICPTTCTPPITSSTTSCCDSTAPSLSITSLSCRLPSCPSCPKNLSVLNGMNPNCFAACAFTHPP